MKAQSGRPVVRLLPVSVPDYIDTRHILHRDRQNEVTASYTGLCVERLSVDVTHALAASLATDLPDVVSVTSQPGVPPSRAIMVDVLQFEIGHGGKVLRWESDSFVEQTPQTADEESRRPRPAR